MNNKHYALFAFLCFFGANTILSNQCDDFYAKVTYGLSHTKKALGATNFEHQMYYAERALIAIEKSQTFMGECDCAKSEDKTLDVIEVLNKAIDPVDWDAGRYFSKKSMGMINELITILDECTLGTTPETIVEDSAEITLEHEAYAEDKENEVSMEEEMIKVFDKHANDRLNATKKAVAQLVQLSKSFSLGSLEKENGKESLEHHQKKYLENAKKLLQEGLDALEAEK